MCRNIKRLRQESQRSGREEAEMAARQYVRKVTGFRQPSAANQEAFERAVARITDATDDLLSELTLRGVPLSMP